MAGMAAGRSERRSASDATHHDRHPLVVADSITNREETGEPSRAGRAHVETGVDRHRMSAARSRIQERRRVPHRCGACSRRRRSSRTSRRRGCRRRASAGRPTRSSRRSSAALAARTPPARSHPAASGAQPAACTAWSRAPDADSARPSPTQVANAPPPTCTNTRSSSIPRAADWSSISHPIVRPPSRHSAFSGPCTVNGIAPASTASRNRSIAGSPGGSDASRSQRWIVRAQGASRTPTPSAHPGRGRTRRSASRRPPPASPRRSPRCRTMRSPAAVARRAPERLGGEEVQQDRHQMARLLAAGDVVRLVLDPHAAGRPEAECVGEGGGPGERRDPEPDAVDPADRRRRPSRRAHAGHRRTSRAPPRTPPTRSASSNRTNGFAFSSGTSCAPACARCSRERSRSRWCRSVASSSGSATGTARRCRGAPRTPRTPSRSHRASTST